MSIPAFLFIFGMLNLLMPLSALLKFYKENDISSVSEADIILFMMKNYSFEQIITIRAFGVSGMMFIFSSIILAIST